MNINGHQIRSILGEPSEDNQVSSIDDERVFQISAPLVVHGKLFDPSDHEKKTTINKVVVKMCEDGSENQGVAKTFGGQSSARPFRNSCDPVNVYSYNNFLLSSVAAGQSYIISASTVLNVSGTTLATLAPGEIYVVPAGANATVLDSTGGTLALISGGLSGTITDSTIFNSTGGTVGTVTAQGAFLAPDSTVFDYSGGTLASLAPSGRFTVEAVNILWSSGGTVATLGPSSSYPLEAVTVLNHTGGTVFNDAEQGQTRSLSAGVVFNFSGGTLANLAPNGVFTVAAATGVVSNSAGVLKLDTTLGPGDSFAYVVSDLKISNNRPKQIFSISGGGSSFFLDDISWINSDGASLSFLPIYYDLEMTAPNIDIIDSSGMSANTVLSGTVYTNFSGIVTVENSNSSFVTGYTSFGTYPLSDISILNSSGGTVDTWPAVSAYTIGDVVYRNSTGGTLAFMPSIYPLNGQIQIPQFSIINSDGQSGTTFAYNNQVHTNFSGGGSGTQIIYQRPSPFIDGTVYRTGDTEWHAKNGSYDFNAVTASTVVAAALSYTATESDVRETYHGTIGDGTDLIAPTYLSNNNFFGNKFRFTDSLGNKSDSSASSLWAHVDFNGHNYTGAINNYVIDHFTGVGMYLNYITSGSAFNMNTTTSDGASWESWIDYLKVFSYSGFSNWRPYSVNEMTIGPMGAFLTAGLYDWAGEFFNGERSDNRMYCLLGESENATEAMFGFDSSAPELTIDQTKAGGSGFGHRITNIFGIRTHY